MCIKEPCGTPIEPQPFEWPKIEVVTPLDLYAATAMSSLLKYGYNPDVLAKKSFEIAKAMMEERNAHVPNISNIGTTVYPDGYGYSPLDACT